jgi:hypothetical protein
MIRTGSVTEIPLRFCSLHPRGVARGTHTACALVRAGARAMLMRNMRMLPWPQWR